MYIKRTIKVLTLCLLLAVLSSCQTKEEKVIGKMQKLVERVEQKSDSFDEKEWQQIIDDFEALQEEAKGCDFTKDQTKEFAKAEGELAAAIAKQGAKQLGKGLKDLFDEGKEALNGAVEGIKEGLGIDEEAETE